jgi:polar amino acid transport system substrate-binding protein
MLGRHSAWFVFARQNLIALLYLVLPATAVAEVLTAPAIRAGYIEFPPYSYTDQHGEAAGDLINLIKLLAQRNKLQVEFSQYPGFRIFKTLESGQVELWATAYNHPLLKHALQSRYRLGLNLNLYYLGNVAPKLPQALRNKRLLLIQGFAYPGSPLTRYTEDPSYNITTITAPTHEAAVQMLHLKRADYLLHYEGPLEQTTPPVPEHVTVLEQDFALTYSTRSPRAQRLRNDFDRTLRQLKDDKQLPASSIGALLRVEERL